MAFDFSTLVTDRTMADVLARNAKGTYNATDLNRVDECLEDLVARLGRMGYNVPGYQRIKLSREAKPTSRLPEGYTELAYIQSTGEQYVDSGIIPNQDTRVYAECVLPISTGSTQALFGCRVSSSSRQFQFVTQGGYYRTDYNTTINNFTENSYGEAKFYVDKNKNLTDVNGDYSVSQTYGAFTCPGNLYIFATNNNGAVYAKSFVTLYTLKIYDNGVLARDFVPCISPTGSVGLYDLIGGQFYGNSGTGKFLAGPAISWPEAEESEAPAGDLDPYTWYESDVPTASQMAQYRGNVSAVRAVLQLPEGAPEPPGTMEQLTTAGTNNIEAVLLAVDLILNHIQAAVRHCGVTVCGSKGVIA